MGVNVGTVCAVFLLLAIQAMAVSESASFQHISGTFLSLQMLLFLFCFMFLALFNASWMIAVFLEFIERDKKTEKKVYTFYLINRFWLIKFNIHFNNHGVTT